GSKAELTAPIGRPAMSALGHKRTSRLVGAMSALPPIADIGTQQRDVCFVPKADSCTAARASLFHPRPPGIAGGYVRGATGAGLEEHSGRKSQLSVMWSDHHVIWFATLVWSSRLNEQPPFPRGAARSTWARRGD